MYNSTVYASSKKKDIFRTKTVLVIDTRQEVLKRTNGDITTISEWQETKTHIPIMSAHGAKQTLLNSTMLGSMFKFVHNSNFLYKSLCIFFVLHFQHTFTMIFSSGSLSVFRNSVRNTSPKLPRPMCFLRKACCIQTAESPELQKPPRAFCPQALLAGMVLTFCKLFR